jgi:hypothetical protein
MHEPGLQVIEHQEAIALTGAFPSGLVLSNEEMVTQPLQLAAFKVQRQVSGKFEVPTTLS